MIGMRRLQRLARASNVCRPRHYSVLASTTNLQSFRQKNDSIHHKKNAPYNKFVRSFSSRTPTTAEDFAENVVHMTSSVSPQCALACRGFESAYAENQEVDEFFKWAKDDLDRFQKFLHILQDHCGLPVILTMRRDLAKAARDDDGLKKVGVVIRSSLAQWVKPGLLHTEILKYDKSDSLVHTVAAMDAILPTVPSEDPLFKDRLGPGRRCFVLLHPALPRTMPLCFTHVALLPKIPTGYDDIYNNCTEDNPTVATFYAITNPTPGLEGLNLGNILIVDAVNRLMVDVPSLQEFCTLSPIPGFKSWLDKKKKAPAIDDQQNMMSFCAKYLTKEKRGKSALDPVANFHLSNGAEMGELRWQADTNSIGLVPTTSYGMMINYRYYPNKLEENHRDYKKGGLIHQHETLKALIKGHESEIDSE